MKEGQVYRFSGSNYKLEVIGHSEVYLEHVGTGITHKVDMNIFKRYYSLDRQVAVRSTLAQKKNRLKRLMNRTLNFIDKVFRKLIHWW